MNYDVEFLKDQVRVSVPGACVYLPAETTPDDIRSAGMDLLASAPVGMDSGAVDMDKASKIDALRSSYEEFNASQPEITEEVIAQWAESKGLQVGKAENIQT